MFTRTPTTITYRGKTRTVLEWSLALGIPDDTIRGRLNKGLSPTAILCTGYPHCRHRNVRLITYRGKAQTIRQWSYELHLSTGTINQRIYRGITDPETLFCLDRLASANEIVRYKGKPRLWKELAVECGLKTQCLKRRAESMPLKKAMSIVCLKPRPWAKKYTCNGKSFDLRGWAKRLGCTRQGLHLRLKSYPPEIALDKVKWSETLRSKRINPKKRGKISKKYACNGESLTVREWAKRLGVVENTVYHRLKTLPLAVALKYDT